MNKQEQPTRCDEKLKLKKNSTKVLQSLTVRTGAKGAPEAAAFSTRTGYQYCC